MAEAGQDLERREATGAMMDSIDIQVAWQKLICIADEMALSITRTAFSPIIRESHDVGAVIFDARGRQLAQVTFATPTFSNTTRRTLRAMLERFPPETLRPGDVLITNDPWIGTGHLYDCTAIMPVFRDGHLLGFVGAIAHLPDIGGGTVPEVIREVYEEGLRIPIAKLLEHGQPNRSLQEVIAANVRAPEEALGDLEALTSALFVGRDAMIDMLAAQGLPDLDGLGAEIVGRSEAAMAARISEVLAPGTYRAIIFTDGFQEPMRIEVAVKVVGHRVMADYSGSSPEADQGINCVLNYTYAWSVFALKAILHPSLPSNEGSFAPFAASAPEGSFLNARFPRAVRMRGKTGEYLPMAIFRALAAAVPDRVIAACGAPAWTHYVHGRNEAGGSRVFLQVLTAGQGARPTKDGISCLGFPAPIANTPVEVLENTIPFIVREKAFRPDSGGSGRYRGGLGQRYTLECRASHPWLLNTSHERHRIAAEGLLGGRAGANGVNLLNGTPFPGKTQIVVQPGDQVTFLVPGGGGMFPPFERDPALVLRDVVEGLVSMEAAETEYGVAIDAQRQTPDEGRTAALRGGGS